MKTVFNDTAKVAHIWAHQTQPTARYRDNFRCDGALLFSYSTRVGHIVRRPDNGNRIGERVAFLTAETYSVTTSRHMGDAWQATRHMERYALPDLDNLSPALATLARNFDTDGGKGARKAIRAYHAATDDNGGRWRDGWQYVEAARAVEKWIGDNVAAILASATAEPDSWRATGTLREAAELIRATGVERDASGAIVGGLLETSHGADVPLAHAVKAFRFVKLVRERGETWRRNGRTIRVGHYQIDAIDAGGFTAGCHRINWGEIERLARELGVLDAPADDSAVIQSAHA